MALAVPVVWTDAHRLHDPESAVWVGVPIPADELPERAEATRAALEEVGAPIVLASPHPDEPLRRRLGALGLPTVFVQEGGYVLDTIGPLVRATLEKFEEETV